MVEVLGFSHGHFLKSELFIIEQDDSYAEAGRNLGVNPNQLSRRKREIAEDSGDPGSTVFLQAELKRVRKENKRLKLEREIFKKAATFFA